jgi:hypothetical protein
MRIKSFDERGNRPEIIICFRASEADPLFRAWKRSSLRCRGHHESQTVEVEKESQASMSDLSVSESI